MRTKLPTIVFFVLLLAWVFWSQFFWDMPVNSEHSFKHWSPRAQKGEAVAQYNLGIMYENGLSYVAQDYKEAARWYLLSAEQGNADAQFVLGDMYAEGRGVPQDYVRSHMWWSFSAALGDETATYEKNAQAHKMTSSQIAKAEQLAGRCIQQNYKNC
jgi:TPR repeat protein